ncbi:MAG: putative endonuclease [Bradyrhizobium sp.]|jgi:putative endonuclease|nr:putative endonuclease [Bradyrhizobium sp.]
MAIYVYMLRCADNSYYIGSATGDDLQPRIDQHNSGAFPGYTFHRRPVTLAAERQIKGWSRAKKEALIRGDWTTIHQLSRRGGKSRQR